MCSIMIKNKILGVGVVTLVLALIGVALTLYVIIQVEELKRPDKNQFQGFNHSKDHVLNLNLEKNVIEILTALFLVLFVLAVFFSILLIVGIKKNNKEFVISYFSYGILITILMFIIGLLELLQGCWRFGLLIMFFTVKYCCCLKIVYEGYEMMVNGVSFDDNPDALLLDNVE